MNLSDRFSRSEVRDLSFLTGLVYAFLVFIPVETLVIGCGADTPRQPGNGTGSGGEGVQTGGVGGPESSGSSASGTDGSSASGSGGSSALTGGIGGIIFDGAVADGSGDGSTTIITGGSGATSGSGGTSGSAGSPPAGSCAMSAERVRITEINVGSTVLTGEDEYNMNMLAISPIPSGGSRLAWRSNDGVHIAQLDVNDQITGTPLVLPAHDFSDIYADDNGGVVLLTRDAQGGGNLNCGDINNLCGNAASYPTEYACFDMYMARFDGNTETWATKLTDSSASRPPYGTSPTDSNRTTFVWSWYGHHGRIAFDGSRWAGYFGVSISGSSQVLTMSGCAQPDSTLAVGIDIHQGDQMRIVDANGTVQAESGFQLGCSHSYYERLVWDPATSRFIPICETDRDNTLSFAPMGPSIYAIDMQRSMPANYSNLGSIVLGSNGGYWVALSKSRASAAGMADVHLLHFAAGAPDIDTIISNDATLNCRAAHLGKYGGSRLVAGWETSASANDYTAWTTDRKFYIQAHSASTGEAEGGPFQVDIKGNKYYAFRDFPDGSVAYPAAGSSATTIKVVRVLPCN